MDSPSGLSGLSHTDSPSYEPQSTLSRNTSERGTDNRLNGQGVDTLRRGHSDGDVLTAVSGPRRNMMGDISASEGETWMDFLRESPGNGQAPQEWAQAAARRAAMVAADRKRRMTVQHADFARRRSASSLSYGQAANARMRQNLAQIPIDKPLTRPLRATGNHSDTDSTERQLFRPPSMADLQNHRGKEIVLPRWQPDPEVSKCPICDTTFSFFYRKHHCRKCGRVVCANCSPHRITIPRQFIVHAPAEVGPGSNPGGSANSNIIDLTRDDSENPASPRPALRVEGRSRSQDYHLDPALGGGQEVRLCNPCVPDPNPLPPPTYNSPAQHAFNSFPTPDSFAVRSPPQTPLPAARALLSHTQPPVVPVISPSSGQVGETYRQSNPLRHETHAAQRPTDPSSIPGQYESLEDFLLRQRGRGFAVSSATIITLNINEC